MVCYSKNRNKDYCNKDWHQFCQYWWVYVNFENGFTYWENSGNYHPENIIKISEICKKSIFARDSLQLSHFFAVHSNFTLKLIILWNFILKLYLRFWAILNLLVNRVSPNFLHLINFNDIFLWRQNSKNEKIKPIYKIGINYLFIHMIKKFFKKYRTCP